MPLYMTHFAYTSEGLRDLVNNPEANKDLGARLGQSFDFMGARLVSLYFSFGGFDGLVIYEAPDDTTAGSVVFHFAVTGLQVTKTTSLFTAEESVEMVRSAGHTPYA
jgi:uncharacterized protein with GYD domain